MKSELSDSRQTKRKNAQKTTLENTKKKDPERGFQNHPYTKAKDGVCHIKNERKKYVAIAMAITAVPRCRA